jgi:hypothetical protein
LYRNGLEAGIEDGSPEKDIDQAGKERRICRIDWDELHGLEGIALHSLCCALA